MKRIRVYVAGRLNDMACDYIKNLHRMFKVDRDLRRLGFAPYCPGLDMLTGLLAGDMEYEDYFDPSQAWLEVSQAVCLTPGWEGSKGTAKEIARATEFNIPVFKTVEQMTFYFRELGEL
jgi:hypothetical protein